MTLNQTLPALSALEQLRTHLKTRVGKEGGNLNRLVLSHLDTIEATLRQIEPITNMVNVLNQQSQVAIHTLRALSHVQAMLPEANGPAVDDGTSPTKGQ